jgi:hypothetical protein
VLLVVLEAMKPFARVKGLLGLFWTLRLFESGACCIIREARFM